MSWFTWYEIWVCKKKVPGKKVPWKKIPQKRYSGKKEPAEEVPEKNVPEKVCSIEEIIGKSREPREVNIFFKFVSIDLTPRSHTDQKMFDAHSTIPHTPNCGKHASGDLNPGIGDRS